MSGTIDLGNGQTVQRQHLPAHMVHTADQASAALEQALGTIRRWIKPLHAMQAPAGASGTVICNAVGQSGRTYSLPETGGALLVDERDLPTFATLKFVAVPSGAAPTTPWVGSVFMDTEVNGYMRWNGSAWAPVTLQ